VNVENLMKRLLARWCFLLLGLASVWGAVADSPQDVIKETSQRMIAALNKDRPALQQDASKIYDLVDQILLPHFDFELISRWALGKYWRSASPEQRTRFTDQFRTLLVRTYASALLEYSNEEIRFPATSAPAANTNDVTVPTQVQPRSGAPIPINYSMHFMNGAWKVYDVTVDGISLVTNYRDTFVSQIRDGGMDAVIQGLEQRNQQGTR
jgi:phospholipid transport system substrate-binding protein